MITKSFTGHYELTKRGLDFIDTCEREDSKNLIRLENMRYKFPIIDGVDKLVKQRTWDKIQPMKNNVTIYHTKEEGLHVRVISSSENPCLEITCRPRTGTNVYELMYEARRWVEFIAKRFEKYFPIVLGMVQPVMEPEWAIPSKQAGVLLKKTNSSQIRTPDGVINKSKGRDYDIETRDIRLANKLFNLPYVVDDIAREVKLLRAADHSGLFCF
jgi:hypothetical protein